MRGRGEVEEEDEGAEEEVGACRGRRTTPGEATLQERGGAHALQT